LPSMALTWALAPSDIAPSFSCVTWLTSLWSPGLTGNNASQSPEGSH
jgi:hypothetical protein